MSKKIVATFSGGETSACMAISLIEKFGKDNIEFIYADTGGEHPETYKFIRAVNDYLKLNLTCLQGDFSLPLGEGVGYKIVDINTLGYTLGPFKSLIEKYGVPYVSGMFCSERMKTKPIDKYLDEKYGKGNHERWLGMRVDEPTRLKDKPDIHYFAEISDFEKEDVRDFWGKMPFRLGIPEWLGNCVFCPKKSNLKLAAAYHDERVLYMNWLDMLYGESVRIDDKTGHWSNMYRGSQSLSNLIATFDGSTGVEIKNRIRGTKSTNTESCSDSCEGV